MKRKLLCLLLLFTLVFAVGCNKEEDKAAPTPTTAATEAPTSTPTPTPTPVNLAKENLEKLPAVLDTLMSYQPENVVDYSKGVGYDISLELSIGQQIAELLQLTGLNSISASGTVDVKDTVAANLTMYLNTSEVVNAHVFADAENLLFNLPKYSANYAATTWTELMNSTNGEEIQWETSEDSSVISTVSTVDKPALPSNEELIKILRTHLESLVNCFQEVDGITPNASIGTGDYTLTGDKHTVSASIKELTAVLESLETELSQYMEADFGLEELETAKAASFVLDYYVDENGNYAWAAYPDNEPNLPLVFVDTALGFCLYKVEEDGTTTLGMTSVKSTENSGVVYLYFNDEEAEDAEEPMGTVDYEYDENSFSIDAVLDTIELTMDCSNVNDTVTYDITMVVEGVSIVMEEKVSKDHAEIVLTLASYGIEYVTMTMTMDLRDYVEIPVPKNTVDIETWSAGLDQTALTNDLTQLITEYPFLASLILGGEDDSDDNYEDDWDDDWDDSSSDEPFTMPESYSDEFMSMTGYSVSADGYVDFTPAKDEVLAIGKASTGFDTIAITEDQKQALLAYGEAAFTNTDRFIDEYYSVWGSVEYNGVESYYQIEYDYSDSNSWDNSISFAFDAVSGEFYGVSIYNTDTDTAFRMANDVMKLLGIEYTVTKEIVEEYTFDQGFAFSGYDAAQYGGNYYNIDISVYNTDW